MKNLHIPRWKWSRPKSRLHLTNPAFPQNDKIHYPPHITTKAAAEILAKLSLGNLDNLFKKGDFCKIVMTPLFSCFFLSRSQNGSPRQTLLQHFQEIAQNPIIQPSNSPVLPGPGQSLATFNNQMSISKPGVYFIFDFKNQLFFPNNSRSLFKKEPG